MEIELTLKANEDLEFWKRTGNKVILKRIRNLLDNILLTPFYGIGKPEQLKYDWVGYWSRRIDKENRLIYKVLSDKIIIFSLRGHYD